eukprot:1180154-Prorocentrum_minimum.AAC.6
MEDVAAAAAAARKAADEADGNLPVMLREPKAEIPPIPGPLRNTKLRLSHIPPLNARKVEAALAIISKHQAIADAKAGGEAMEVDGGAESEPPKWEDTLQAVLEATAPLTPIISTNPLKQVRASHNQCRGHCE